MHIYQYTVGCFLNFDICAKRASTCITTYIKRSRGCHQFILSWYKEPYRELVMDVSELFFYVCNVIFEQRLPGFIHCTGFTVRNSSCGKVRSMFSQMSVCPRGGRCTTSIRQILPPWTDPPPPRSRQSLQRTVRILLESILVFFVKLHFMTFATNTNNLYSKRN